MGKTNFAPRISIIIPVYNGSNYLREAIDSALAQTYPNVEIIVVNDGSNDDGATERIALSYGDQIRYLAKENGGSSSALNLGIANMTGEWFSWLSHDDLYVPEKLEKQVAHMEGLGIDENFLYKHVFFSAWDLVDATGKTIMKYDDGKAKTMAEKVEAIPHNGYLIAEPTEFIFHGCSCLIHRDVFDNVGFLDEKLRLLNDVDLWYRIYEAGYKVHFIPEVLVKGRIHGKQVSRTISYSQHNPEQDMYWNRSLDWLIENYPDEEDLFFLYGRNAYLKGRNAEGDRAFEQIHFAGGKKAVRKIVYKGRACIRSFAKKVYLKLKVS